MQREQSEKEQRQKIENKRKPVQKDKQCKTKGETIEKHEQQANIHKQTNEKT